jgi:pilin isopeptide linkage protein
LAGDTPGNPTGNHIWRFTGWDPVPNYDSDVTSDATYVARWTKIDYTVTYLPGDHGTLTDGPTVFNKHYGDATPEFTGKKTGNPGYAFAGWDPAVADKVTGDATYTAQWVYNANPATVTLRAVKTANVPMKAGLFEFALCESDADGKQGKEIETQTNGAGRESAVVFDAISYGESGTWLYLMREKQTNLSGWTTDNAQYLISVSVSDDGKGQHIAVVSVKNGEEWVPYVPYAGAGTADAASLRFANGYASPNRSPSPPEKPEPGAEEDPPVPAGPDGPDTDPDPDTDPAAEPEPAPEEYTPPGELPQTGATASEAAGKAALAAVLALLLALAAGVILRKRFTHTQKP